MVTYYAVLSGNILEAKRFKGKKIIGQMIISSGTIDVAHKLETYEDFEMIREHMWERADPAVKSLTNKSNVHISFIYKVKNA